MVPQVVPICGQCGTHIEGRPVTLGDEVFCCLGCVGGGPCICEQEQTETLLLRVGPFASQSELMRFATRLERASGLVHVEMTRSDLDEARFTVDALSTEALALAVEVDPDHTVTIETSGTTVHARLAAPQRRSRELPTVDALLPARTRFRVFRLPGESAALDETPQPASHPAPRASGLHFPDPPRPIDPEIEAHAAARVAAQATAQAAARAQAEAEAEAHVAQAQLEARERAEAEALAVTRAQATALAEAEARARAATAAQRESDRSPINEVQVAELLTSAREAAGAQRPAVPAPPDHAPIARAAAVARVGYGTPAQPPADPRDEVQELAIVAAPFHSFLALNEFQGAVRALPGVRDTRVRRFYGGSLNLAVDYADGVPLAERLRAAQGDAWRIVAASDDRIEIALSEASSLATTPIDR